MEILHPPALKIDKVLYGKDNNGRPHPEGVLERRIVWNLFAHLKAAGFDVVVVYDGENEEKVSDAAEAMEFIFNLDEAHVHFRKDGRAHWLFLVLGNGIDILSDWGIPKTSTGFDEALNAFDAEDYA